MKPGDVTEAGRIGADALTVGRNRDGERVQCGLGCYTPEAVLTEAPSLIGMEARPP